MKPYRTQLTQPGWDGTFTWGPGVPSPNVTDGDGSGSQLSGFGSGPSFSGFTGWMEGGQIGPDSAIAGTPSGSSGPFPYNPRGGDFPGSRRQNE